MSAPDTHWHEIVSIRARYQRSVHLERDFNSTSSLQGYLVTPLVLSVVKRIGDGLMPAAGARAWSITGPYGSGKSALALFLAKLLSVPLRKKEREAWDLLKERDGELAKQLVRSASLQGDAGLCVVLATGEKRPLEQTLMLALKRAVEVYWAGRGAKPDVVRRITRLVDRAEPAARLPARDLVALFEEVADKVAASRSSGSGLLVLLDEAGKALEFAAQSRDGGDIQVLQELAEAANRSRESPLLLVTLLHQSFDQYAGRLNSSQRREWAKVQGRFEDIAFQEDPGETIRLIASALDLRCKDKRLATSVTALGKDVAAAIAALASHRLFRDRKILRDLLAAATPLHPVTTLALGPFFRSELAQNERSLFAFLSSGEPKGFQEFLQTEKALPRAAALFTIDRLYDYIVAAYGGRLTGHYGRQIAAVGEAIRRLPEKSGDLEVRVLKAIGLIGTLGDATGLVASEDLVQAALGDETRQSRSEIRRAIGALQAASLLVYRKYRDAYQIWEGSDLDIDLLVRTASRQIDPQSGLISRINRVMRPRPLIARRHLLQTGTLRYFPVRYDDETTLDGELAVESGTADGYARVVLPIDRSRVESLRESLTKPHASVVSDRRPYLTGVALQTDRLRETALDVAALEWVQAHTPELQTDRVAHREMAARLAEAEGRLKTEVDRLFWDGNACHWYFRGERLTVERTTDLTRIISDICDRVYCSAPTIHNELLNRPNLSSAAAAGRKALLRAMIESPTKPKLGFEGFPPEYSMYRSFLEEHGLHREHDGKWAFWEPLERDVGSLRPAWQAIERAVSRAEGARINIKSLYDILREPPFGIKDGLLPVVLIAVALRLEAELAIYEEGTFLPALTVAVVERLLRAPERFEVQRFQIEGARADFLDKLAGSALARPDEHQKLLPIVRQLVRLVRQLPDFSRNTRRVSGHTQAFREALLRAREPGPLVFRELPLALGLEPLEPRLTEEGVAQLLERLRAALRELQVAYAHLLDSIEGSLGQAFGLRSKGRGLRTALRDRATALLPLAVEPDLRAFLLRLGEERLEREEWLASIATVLAGKPPEGWHDVDLERARIKLALHGQQINSLEALVVAGKGQPTSPSTRLLRISVMETGHAESARVLALEDERDEERRGLCVRILEAVGESPTTDDLLVALALLSQELLGRPKRRPRHMTTGAQA